MRKFKWGFFVSVVWIISREKVNFNCIKNFNERKNINENMLKVVYEVRARNVTNCYFHPFKRKQTLSISGKWWMWKCMHDLKMKMWHVKFPCQFFFCSDAPKVVVLLFSQNFYIHFCKPNYQWFTHDSS